jgi:hypothetical protein
LIVTCGVITVLVLGFITVSRRGGSDGPENLIEAFFAALTHRDGAEARALGSGCVNSPVCTPGGLSSGYEPPAALKVGKVEYGKSKPDDPTRRPNKDVATVEVSYVVGGTAYPDTFFLIRDKGASGSQKWSFENPVGRPLTINSPVVSEARVGGATVEISAIEIPSSSKGKFRNLWLVPGVYDVKGVSTVMFDMTPQQVTIGGRDGCVVIPGSGVGSNSVSTLHGVPGVRVVLGCVSPDANLNLNLRPGVLDEVARQVHAYIDKCAAQPDAQPRIRIGGITRNCPFHEEDYVQRIGNMRNLVWSITKYPELSLESPSEGAAAVETVVPGVATLTFDWTSKIIGQLDGWTRLSVEVPIRIGGRATADPANPDAIVWSLG